MFSLQGSGESADSQHFHSRVLSILMYEYISGPLTSPLSVECFPISAHSGSDPSSCDFKNYLCAGNSQVTFLLQIFLLIFKFVYPSFCPVSPFGCLVGISVITVQKSAPADLCPRICSTLWFPSGQSHLASYSAKSHSI